MAQAGQWQQQQQDEEPATPSAPEQEETPVEQQDAQQLHQLPQQPAQDQAQEETPAAWPVAQAGQWQQQQPAQQLHLLPQQPLVAVPQVVKRQQPDEEPLTIAETCQAVSEHYDKVCGVRDQLTALLTQQCGAEVEQLPEVLRQIGAEQLRLETALPPLPEVLEVAVEVWEVADFMAYFVELAHGVKCSDLLQAHRDLYEAGSIQVDMNGVILQARIEAASGAGHETWETMQRLLNEMRVLFPEHVRVTEDRAAKRQFLRQQAIEVAEAARVAAQAASGAEEQPDEEEELAPLILLRSFLQTGYRRFQDAAVSNDRMEEVCQVVGQWQHLRQVGFADYRKSNFIKLANRWSIGCLKALCKGKGNVLATTHRRLGTDIPTQYWPDGKGSPPVAPEHIAISVKDMVEAHDGELREVTGHWEEQVGHVPTQQEEPDLYKCQFACTQRDYLAWQVPGKCKPRQGSGDVISTILKKSASGGDQFFVRKAQVIGLGELLFFFGEKFTAGELYAYFVNARKLTCKRPRAWINPERRQQLLLWQQVINHHALTNTWGLGREMPVGQPDRREREGREKKGQKGGK